MAGRSPHGERGLKSYRIIPIPEDMLSLSSWRAWIEIRWAISQSKVMPVALLMESVD